MEDNNGISEMHPKIFVILGIFAVMLIVSIIYGVWKPVSWYSRKPKTSPIAYQNDFQIEDKIIHFSPGVTPPGFPDESILPLPKGSVITASYSASPVNGRAQISETLENNLSVKENYDFYKNIFSDKKYGWTILDDGIPQRGENIAGIFAENQQGRISLSVTFLESKKCQLIITYCTNK